MANNNPHELIRSLHTFAELGNLDDLERTILLCEQQHISLNVREPTLLRLNIPMPQSLSELLSSADLPNWRTKINWAELSFGAITPLHVATLKNHTSCVSALLQAGASPDSFADQQLGISPLMTSVLQEQPAITELLLSYLSHHACIRSNYIGLTSLHIAAMTGNIRVLSTLCQICSSLSYPVDIPSTFADYIFNDVRQYFLQSSGLKPLYEEMQHTMNQIEDLELVKSRCISGRDNVSAPDRQHINIDANARAHKNPLTKTLPKSRGITFYDGATPILFAVYFGQMHAMQTLHCFGADYSAACCFFTQNEISTVHNINFPHVWCTTPLHQALYRQTIVSMLNDVNKHNVDQMVLFLLEGLPWERRKSIILYRYRQNTKYVAKRHAKRSKQRRHTLEQDAILYGGKQWIARSYQNRHERSNTDTSHRYLHNSAMPTNGSSELIYISDSVVDSAYMNTRISPICAHGTAVDLMVESRRVSGCSSSISTASSSGKNYTKTKRLDNITAKVSDLRTPRSRMRTSSVHSLDSIFSQNLGISLSVRSGERNVCMRRMQQQQDCTIPSSQSCDHLNHSTSSMTTDMTPSMTNYQTVIVTQTTSNDINLNCTTHTSVTRYSSTLSESNQSCTSGDNQSMSTDANVRRYGGGIQLGREPPGLGYGASAFSYVP